MNFQEILEIGGKEYTFIANRKARVEFNDAFKRMALKLDKQKVANISDAFSTNDVLDTVTMSLLKQSHNLGLKESQELRELASSENEYGDKFDEFINALFEKTTVVGKKIINFLEAKD